MQPAFIRLIDNLRKQLDQSTWRGTYEELPLWSDGVSDEVRTQVMDLRARLKTASLDEAQQIEQTLADLPSPYPSYHLHLKKDDRQVSVDLWDVCYQICFRDYDVASGTSRSRGFGQPPSQSVEVDATLLDATGDIDWDRLDDKARKLVEQIFAALPS